MSKLNHNTIKLNHTRGKAMSAISLEKRAEKVKICLKKHNIENVECQVKFAIDRSGSMDNLYHDHTVQDVVERVLAIGMQVDKDKSIDVWAFHDESVELPAVKENNIVGFVEREIVKKVRSGGTSYGPVMHAIVESALPVGPVSQVVHKASGFFGGLFGKKPTVVEQGFTTVTATGTDPADPVLAVFLTDGENGDRGAAEQAIIDSQNKNIYWMLIGIGHGNFSFIEKLGDKYPNCGYFPIKDIKTISDEALYDQIICKEFAEWVAKF